MKYLILLFISIQTSFALVSVGSYVPNAFRSQDKKEGGTKKIALNPFVSLDYTFSDIFWRQSFNPEIGYALHTKQFDGTKHTTLFLMYNLEHNFTPNLIFRYGFGTFIDKISGDGGVVTLSNGSGTADFFRPSESKTSYTSSLNLGMKFLFLSNSAIRFDINIKRFLSSDKRGLNYLLSYNLLSWGPSYGY